MEYIKDSEALTGYRVKIVKRPAFWVCGYTMTLPPGPAGEAAIPRFWDAVVTDGRREALIKASANPPWVLALGSWDPECPRGGQRYTICIEETPQTDFSRLSGELFRKQIGASEWMCFETMLGRDYPGRFWKDDPYKMLPKLGYVFHRREGDFSVGLHFEAYPPGFDARTQAVMEFWITVAKG